MKKLAAYTSIAIATLAVVFLLWQFRLAVFLFFLSLVMASILRPMVNSLVAHKIPRGWALTITYFVLLLIIVAFLVFIGGPILSEVQGIAQSLPKTYENLHTAWLKGPWLEHTIAVNVPDFNNLTQSISKSEAGAFLKSILSITQSTFDLGADIVIIIALSIYWSADEEHFKRLWLSLLPPRIRTRSRDIWQNLDREMGAYLRSELIQTILTLVILSIGYQVIGLRHPLLIALFGALSWLMVWFGSFLAIVLAFLAGLMISPLIGGVTALFTVVVLAFLEFVVQPRLFNRAWVSSLLLLIVVLLMVSEFGIFGFIFAPPIAAVAQILGKQLLLPPAPASLPQAAPPVVKVDILRERLDALQIHTSQNPEAVSPEVQNLMARLEKLIDRTKQEEPFID